MFQYFQYAYGPVRFWIVLLLVWTLIWKGIALWKAAQKGQKAWYVALLILNTAGILEILYIYVFSNMKHKKEVSVSTVSQ
jgi:hypothetical protein